MMQAIDLLEIVNLLKVANVPVWLDGGWGVDALVGQQTRLHDDLDVVVPMADVQRIQQLLSAHEFTIIENELPTRFVMCDASSRRIDFHPVTFDEEGGGIQQLQDGSSWYYPPDGFSGTGDVGGHEMNCLTAEVQMMCHVGYTPDAHDCHDVNLLHQHFGIPLPPVYKQAVASGNDSLSFSAKFYLTYILVLFVVYQGLNWSPLCLTSREAFF